MYERDGLTYLTCADTAKLVRAALKKSFPMVKFAVRSSTYSGGASIRVDWTDGPLTKAVERVVSVFAGAGFDGMIDLKFYKSHWMLPDGSVCFASTEGTEGSHGVYSAESNPKPHPDAKRISLGADSVHCQRSISPALMAQACERVARETGLPLLTVDQHGCPSGPASQSRVPWKLINYDGVNDICHSDYDGDWYQQLVQSVAWATEGAR